MQICLSLWFHNDILKTATFWAFQETSSLYWKLGIKLKQSPISSLPLWISWWSHSRWRCFIIKVLLMDNKEQIKISGHHGAKLNDSPPKFDSLISRLGNEAVHDRKGLSYLFKCWNWYSPGTECVLRMLQTLGLILTTYHTCTNNWCGRVSWALWWTAFDLGSLPGGGGRQDEDGSSFGGWKEEHFTSVGAPDPSKGQKTRFSLKTWGH